MDTSSTDNEIGSVLKHYDEKRENLIPLLQDVQERLTYLPPEAIERIAAHLGLSENDVFGVATFYSQFRFQPRGKHNVRVCQGTACHVMGGARVLEQIIKQLGVEPGQTTEDGRFTLETVNCIGACALAPAMFVDKDTHGRIKPEKIAEILNGVGN